MRLENGNYRVRFDQTSNTVFLIGTLRLQGREEYQQINGLLIDAAESSDGALTIDMQDLEFLNSSGISTLSLFIIEMRKREKTIRIVGNSEISWQSKSIHNFQRLYPGAVVEIIRRGDE